MGKALTLMTAAERAEHLRNHIIAWAMLADTEAGGHPHSIVHSHGRSWEYAVSFLDYGQSEAFFGFDHAAGESVLFLLFIAATLEHAPS